MSEFKTLTDVYEGLLKEEITPQEYEAYKEAMLNLEDELAEMPYEERPADIIKFVQYLTQKVIAFNAGQNWMD